MVVSMRWARGVLLVLLAVGCAAAALTGLRLRPDPVPAPPIPPLSAELQIRRSNTDPSTVSIEVTNQGEVDVRVRRAELVTDSFVSPGPQDVDVLVPHHAAPRDIGVDYGRARCAGRPDPEPSPGTARLEVSTDGATWRTVTVAMPHPDGVLTRLLTDRCGEEYVAERITLTAEWRIADDGTMAGELTVTRVAGPAAEPVELYSVGGSVLYRLTGDSPPPLGELAADADTATFPVGGDMANCSAHALSDVKKPYAFHAWFTIGDLEPIAVPIPVSDSARAEFTGMQDRRCDEH